MNFKQNIFGILLINSFSKKLFGVYPKIYVAKTKDVNFDTTNGLRIAGGWIVPNTFTFIVNYNWNTQDLVITLSYTKYEARNEKGKLVMTQLLT